MDYAGWLQVYQDMTPEERQEYWRDEFRREQIATIDGLHDGIETDEWMIAYVKRWLTLAKEEYLNGEIDETTLRGRLVLGAEVLQGSERSIKLARRDIAEYTKYPFGSKKRKDWLKIKFKRG